jgi:hypothetical protein
MISILTKHKIQNAIMLMQKIKNKERKLHVMQ